MRPLACLAAMALAAPGAVVSAAPAELSPGFTVVTKSSSRHTLLRLDSWRLERKADATSARIDFIVVTFADKETKARIQPILKQGSALALYAPAVCPRALVVVNGSFYIRNGEKTAPLGLVRVNGKTLQGPSQRRSGGFLAINNGKISVLPRAARARALAAADAIESTPIVVRNGANDMRSDDGVRFDRVGVGTATNGKTLVIGAFAEDQDSISLSEFSALSRAAVAATGGRLIDLLAMDGGPSAHIYLPNAKRLYGYRGPAYLPNAICVGAR
jgi:phosphodiester glycosidase